MARVFWKRRRVVRYDRISHTWQVLYPGYGFGPDFTVTSYPTLEEAHTAASNYVGAGSNGDTSRGYARYGYSYGGETWRWPRT